MDWIPGYWAWDDERADFLWVSGIWRALPPGRQWVPGYWGRAENEEHNGSPATGATPRRMKWNTLRSRPQTLEEGPNIELPPDAEHIWAPRLLGLEPERDLPGTGLLGGGSAKLALDPRPLCLVAASYVFIDGYYDYSVARRGVLFAPVYFHSSVYAQGGYSYSPRGGDQPSGVYQPSVLSANVRPLLLWRLLRFQLFLARVLTLVFVPFQSLGYDPFYAHRTVASPQPTTSGNAAWKRFGRRVTTRRRAHRTLGRPSGNAARGAR